jgi:hypothetical protein
VQNLAAPKSIVSISAEIRPINEGSDGAQWRSARRFAVFYFYLEGVSEAKIGLEKVVRSPIGEDITEFAENPDMGTLIGAVKYNKIRLSEGLCNRCKHLKGWLNSNESTKCEIGFYLKPFRTIPDLEFCPFRASITHQRRHHLGYR